mgnify:CR=1 FL=1
MKTIFDRVTELESAVAKLSGLVALQAQQIRVLSGDPVDVLPDPAREAEQLGLEESFDRFVAASGISATAILSDDRRAVTVLARFRCFAAMRSDGFSQSAIARYFNLDVSTVRNGLHRLRELQVAA